MREGKPTHSCDIYHAKRALYQLNITLQIYTSIISSSTIKYNIIFPITTYINKRSLENGESKTE